MVPGRRNILGVVWFSLLVALMVQWFISFATLCYRSSLLQTQILAILLAIKWSIHINYITNIFFSNSLNVVKETGGKTECRFADRFFIAQPHIGDLQAIIL